MPSAAFVLRSSADRDQRYPQLLVPQLFGACRHREYAIVIKWLSICRVSDPREWMQRNHVRAVFFGEDLWDCETNRRNCADIGLRARHRRWDKYG
jgi:hypothetical protein